MRVFISSTTENLEPYRQAAVEVARDQGDEWKPILMEHFGADPRKGIVDFCQEKVRSCDLVIASAVRPASSALSKSLSAS